MDDDPIRIGSASGGALVPDQGSQITTNDFGVQRGTVRHWIGDQSSAQSSRFALGASYSGTLPQFSGFYVDKSGDITGLDGTCAYVDAGYARIDPLWQRLAKIGRELELRQVPISTTVTGLGGSVTSTVDDPLKLYTIPIPHPTATYKYSAATIPGQQGTYNTNANGGGVPAYSHFVIHFNTLDFASASARIEQKIFSANFTSYLILPNGQCTSSTSTASAPVTGFFTDENLAAINLVDFIFSPDPRGWLCLKEDANPVANGQLYEVEQQWKLTMLFTGTQPGTWWTGGRPVHCT